MAWTGKIIGGVLGSLLGPLGTVVGVLLSAWALWADLLPALNVLDRFQLPLTRLDLVDGVERQVPVTGADRTIVDLADRRVWWDGPFVDLSAREFAMLETLVLHPDRTFGSAELQARVFPDAESKGIVVRVYVRQLRQKLGPDVVVTVPGGYRLGVG